MKLYRCTARNKGCESLPKVIKPSLCEWSDWHKAKPDQFCPWANYLCKKKGDKRVKIRFMVEEKGASKTFGEAEVEEKQDEIVGEEQNRVIQSDLRQHIECKGKAKVASRRGFDTGKVRERYLGQAEARLEIERLMKGKK